MMGRLANQSLSRGQTSFWLSLREGSQRALRGAQFRRSRCGAFLLAGLGFCLVLGFIPVFGNESETNPLHWSHLPARDCIRAMASEDIVQDQRLPERVRHELIRRVILLNQSHQWGYRLRSTKISSILQQARGFSAQARSARAFSLEGHEWQLVGGEGRSFPGIRPHFSPAFQTLAHSNLNFVRRPEVTSSTPIRRASHDLAHPLTDFPFIQLAFQQKRSDQVAENLSYQMRSVIPREAEAFFLILHGSGANVSQSGTTLNIARILAAREQEAGDRPRFEARVQERVGEAHLPSAVMSLDLPGSGLGPDIEGFMDLETSSEFLSREVDAIRRKIKWHQRATKREKPIPLVVVARSFSAALMMEMEKRSQRRRVDGYVFIGPEHQSTDYGFDEANERILEIFRGGEFSPNEASLHWAVELGYQMRWYEQSDPVHKVPTMILFGNEDPEMIPQALPEWNALAKTHDHIDFHMIEGAAHDVFAQGRASPSLQSFDLLYQFVRGL